MQTTTAVCAENRNCWKIARAGRAAFLVDAAAYYQAFAEAAERAERSIVVLAWDINGLIRLRRDLRQETLRQFFLRLLKANPRLHIYVLAWDFPLIYAADRELIPAFDAPWRRHPRLHFKWDRQHPIGGCHHQKVAVIDDRLAFVGGLDFTDERWDMPCHLGRDPRRHGFNVASYKPFHDTMMLVEGKVAGDLGDLARERWRRAFEEIPPLKKNGGSELIVDAALSQKDLWPPSIPAEMENVNVAIARTEPAFDGRPEVREIERLFDDAIRSAKRSIYIENQYFTSGVAARALAERLRAPDGPEIIIVLPQGSTGWLEEASLGVLRARMIRDLFSHDRHGRLHIYYPTIGGLAPGAYIKVHSKLIIVDDRFLKIGSANLCNRSMGIDTECDLSIEADSGAREKAIAHFRGRLLAEHLGATPGRISSLYRQTGSLAETIRLCSRLERRLVPFAGEVAPGLEKLIPRNVLLDPGWPLETERMITGYLARRGKIRQVWARLKRAGPFWLANLAAFPMLGFWLLRRRIAKVLWGGAEG